MKKVFVLVLVILGFCNMGCNRYRAELGVRNAFPKAKVYQGYPFEKYYFLVKDNTNTFLVTCYGTKPPAAYRTKQDFLEFYDLNAFFALDTINRDK